MTTKELLNVANTINAAALVGHNYKFANKKKKTTGDFVNMGVTNITGSALLKANADFINGF